MRVLVIGATGGTGKVLVEQLLTDGHTVRAMSRDEGRADALRVVGADPVVADLEGELDHAFAEVDAVAFCAGSGSQTGPDATLRVDLHGAVRTIDLCRQHGISRYLMLSSMAADDPLRGRESIRHYLAAKHAADRILEASGLEATIVRPGGLTDDEPTGHVTIGVPRLPDRGHISRADVARVMARCLEDPATIGVTFELVAGETPIDAALAGLPD
jgi:uncharacterized protein YbjT (DUF2867 family)